MNNLKLTSLASALLFTFVLGTAASTNISYAEDTPQAMNVAPANNATNILLADNTTHISLDNAATKLNEANAVPNVAIASPTKPAQNPAIELRNRIDQYIADKKLNEGREIFYDVQKIGTSMSNPDFYKYRNLAYQRAYMNALSSFIARIGMQINSETMQIAFQDNSSNRAEFPEAKSGVSTTESIYKKLTAYAGAKLDHMLESMDVDPKQYDAADEDQKKQLINNSITSRTVRQFSKHIGGVTVYQTFFANDEQGLAYIGVILGYTPETDSLATSLRNGQKPALTKTGKPLPEIIPFNDPAKLATILGTRLYVDDKGPVVVSFGQWSNSAVGGDADDYAMAQNAAFNQASDIAYSDLSAFLNQNFDAKSESERAELFDKTLKKDGKTDMISEENHRDIIDKTYSMARSKTSQYLQGAKVLKKWIYQTPDGHEVVGVVVSYSFDNILGARKIFDQAQSNTETVQHVDSSYTEGAAETDLDVF